MCAGLAMRGRHFVVLDTVENANAVRRPLIEAISFFPTLAFAPGLVAPPTPTGSKLSKALPPNVKLLTLTSNYADANNGQMLLRLAHMYSVGEHSTLSKPVTVSLADVFGASGLKIVSAVEMSLTANQLAKDMDARVSAAPWQKTSDGKGGIEQNDLAGKRDRLNPDDATMTTTLGPMEIKTFFVKLE